MALVYIGLGSNQGDRSLNIKRSCDELLCAGDFRILKKSAIEETEPVDYLEQPFFLNQIILVGTDIRPEELLEILKKIEINLGRKKTLPKGPRIIDMDILLFDNLILNSTSLTIPHPEIKNRVFILKHLVEITPDLRDPATGIPYMDLLNNAK